MTSNSPVKGTGISNNSTTSRIVSQQVGSRDITKDFLRAASKLPTGLLVKDEYFTLFEAVGAVEIGDAKMDSGYLTAGETMEDTYDVLRDLLPSEVVGIMDQLLCQEMAWHSGHPLSQTLFTSIYIERLLWPEPRSLQQAQFVRDGSTCSPLLQNVLRPYCLGLIKACDLVHGQIIREQYFEEEDFTSQLYNRPLLHKFGTSEVVDLLKDALSWLKASHMQEKEKEALDHRLQLRLRFLTALEVDSQGRKSRNSVDYRACAALLETFRESSGEGVSVPGSFSPKIQKRLASSVPPRPLISIPLAEAIDTFQRLCHDAADIEQLLALRQNGSFLTGISTFMNRANLPSIYIRALLQSMFFHDNASFNGKNTAEFLRYDIASTVWPSSYIINSSQDQNSQPTGSDSHNISQAKDILDNFLTRAGQTYLHLFRTVCLNRCRYRRVLCHSVIDFDNMQAEAEDVDTLLREYTGEEAHVYSTSPGATFAYPISSLVYHYKLQQLEHIIQVGFELSIYAPDEIPHLYWYLSHVGTTHLTHLDRTIFFVEQGSLKVGSFERSAVAQALNRLTRLFVHVRAVVLLARAMHLLYLVLDRCSLLPKPPRPYSSDEFRYELRMRPFQVLSIPEPLSYEDFQAEYTFEGVCNTDILEAATQNIADARKAWEEVLSAGWLDKDESAAIKNVSAEAVKSGGTSLEDQWEKGVKDTIRACIATSIAIATVKKQLGHSSSAVKIPESKSQDTRLALAVLIPQVGEKGCWHPWWIVPKISV